MDPPFNYENRKALVRDGGEDDVITLTTVEDLANVVARAVEFEGEWPVIGGIVGSQTSIREIITLGEEIRGMLFTPFFKIQHTNAPI